MCERDAVATMAKAARLSTSVIYLWMSIKIDQPRTSLAEIRQENLQKTSFRVGFVSIGLGNGKLFEPLLLPSEPSVQSWADVAKKLGF